MPSRINASGVLSESGTDMYSNITLHYSKNRVGSVQTSCIANTAEETVITGTKGRITIHTPAHVPETATLLHFGNSKEERIEIPLPIAPSTLPAFNYPGSIGFAYEALAVEECILKGGTSHPEYPVEESLRLAYIMDEIRHQLGVIYPQDKE